MNGDGQAGRAGRGAPTGTAGRDDAARADGTRDERRVTAGMDGALARRAALARLGLGAAAIYSAPVVLGLRGAGAHHNPGHQGGPPGGGGAPGQGPPGGGGPPGQSCPPGQRPKDDSDHQRC